MLLKSRFGFGLSEALVTVPAMTSAVRFADELFAIPDDYGEGSVLISCDRDFAGAGFTLRGESFTALPPAVLAPAPAAP